MKEASQVRDVSDFFEITRVDNSYKQAIPKRKRPIRPIWNMTMEEADRIRLQAFERWGLEEYAECWTAEIPKRPIPFVSTDERPKRVAEIFQKHIGALLGYFVPLMRPHVQTYNKVSRLGHPINANPTDEAGNLIKMQVIAPLFERLDAGDLSPWRDSYYTIGLRSQNESPSKTREVQFITDDGLAYTEELDRRKYRFSVPELGRMVVGPRSRPVFCPPVINLYLQVWDTMLHRAIMTCPLCEANVYTTEEHPDVASWSSFDCKHYERYLGMLAAPYAAAVGGRYHEWMVKMLHDPYLVPSDTWKTAWLIKPKYRPGEYPQFGSGLCNVSTLGKLANMCVSVEYFMRVKHLSQQLAVYATVSGEHDGLRRWMYGDDNRLRGPEAERASYTDFVGQYFVIEEDETPTYLGTVLRPDIKRFVLPRTTYNLKLYQPERDFSFKSYPALGLVKRRQTFEKFGEPEIATQIIPYENELFASIGPDTEWAQYVLASHNEERRAREAGIQVSALAVTDKDYLMSPEEQLSSGQFWGLPAVETQRIVLSLIGSETKKLLQFN